MHKYVKSINTVIFEGIYLLKAHVVSFFSYLTSVPRTFDLDCSNKVLHTRDRYTSATTAGKADCTDSMRKK